MSAESLDTIDAEFRRFKAWTELDETKLAVELARSARERTLDSVLEATPSDTNTVMQLIGEARGQRLLSEYISDRATALRSAMAEALHNQKTQSEKSGG